MTDKTFFSDDEWQPLAEAPLFVTLAVVAVAEHGPISVIKEAAASAKLLAQPGDRGPATELIAAIAHDAQGHDARHDAKDAPGQGSPRRGRRRGRRRARRRGRRPRQAPSRRGDRGA